MSFTFRVTSLSIHPWHSFQKSNAHHQQPARSDPRTAHQRSRAVHGRHSRPRRQAQHSYYTTSTAGQNSTAVATGHARCPEGTANQALSRQLATPISTSLRRQPCSKPVNPFFYPAFASLSRPQLLLSRTHRLNLTVCGESGHASLGFVLDEEPLSQLAHVFFQCKTASSKQLFVPQPC